MIIRLRVRIARPGRSNLDGMGIYFGFLRPSLLPEDSRYLGASLAQIKSAVPGLLPWLARVFGVFATGLSTVYVAATRFRAGRPGATAIVAVSGLASIAWMAITNFLIGSDFKGLLLAFTVPWAIALTTGVLNSSLLTSRGNSHP